MRNIKKYGSRLFAGCLFTLLVSSCELDYKNTEAINPDDVWKSKTMITGFLNDIYGKMTPGWPYNGNDSDEAINGSGSMGDYQRGIIDVEKNGQGFNYENIDKINFFLDKLAGVGTDVMSETDKNYLTGQALFWRAWDYFGKVTVFGGVPLILKPQDVTDKESLFIPRNKTSECMTQIIKDLDDAIAALPDKWDDVNYGRIDKGAAMAFKGRVLLWYASPMFNPSNDKNRWNDAYQANKDAVTFLTSQGKKLFPDFRQLWYQERNEEVVMVHQYYYPDHAFSMAAIRPEPITQGSSNANQPILNLLLAFPKKDGTPLTLDKNKLNDPVYNANFLTDFYTNRDDRFYTTVFCGGTKYPTPDFDANTKYWCVWRRVEDQTVPAGYKYVSIAADQMQHGANYGISGFFQLKGLDKTLTKTFVGNAGTDWIEIRFAEVLMNYGECANETGKKDEALQVLYDIRKRAGISANDGKYGVTASSVDEIREAYVQERYVEFAFEGKRWSDLRRWKRFSILNEQQYRAGLYVALNEDASLNDFTWTDDITNPDIRKFFHAVYIENLDGDNKYRFNLDEKHWFYPINKEGLDRNSKLEQNNEWGGTFDPLK